jgi:parallel beta-helix repeat protein
VSPSHDILIGGNLASEGNIISDNYTGISIGGDAERIIVEGNTISKSQGHGVVIFTTGLGNTLHNNSIFSSGGLGIELGNDWVTPNDIGDQDIGPNNLMNFPVLTFARINKGKLIVEGIIDTQNPQTVTLEFFANPVPIPGGNPSGYGEGAVFLGTTKPNLLGNFTVSLPAANPGTLISATATDADGNTSEFAANIVVE